MTPLLDVPGQSDATLAHLVRRRNCMVVSSRHIQTPCRTPVGIRGGNHIGGAHDEFKERAQR
ncbi:MAG TPA: hypothetical protein VN680_13595 [Burkholderiaceae bacterium]|nr:hypothetical protein [Burkholderiaceae bacterium]